MKKKNKLDNIESKLPDNLTVKQLKFLKLYIKTGNGTESAMRAYNCKNRVVASTIASQNLSKLADPLKMLMEEKGLSVGKILNVMRGGLEADKPIVVDKKVQQFPDYSVRHKYLQTASVWLGVEKETTLSPNISGNQFNFFGGDLKDKEDFNKKFVEFLKLNG